MRKIKLKSKIIINFLLVFSIYFLIDIALRHHAPNDIATLIKESKSILRSEIWHKSNEIQKLKRAKYDVDCHGIFEMNHEAIEAAERLRNNLNKSLIGDERFYFGKNGEKCAIYREARGYDSIQVSQFEMEFPLAFTIMTYDKVEQFER